MVLQPKYHDTHRIRPVSYTHLDVYKRQVSIKADGTLESVVIDQASPHEVLNEAAKRIVELAAPYAVFPEDIKKDTDILSITRTWTFTQEDALSTE